MLLRKENLARRPFGRSPITDPAPQCPDLPVTEPVRMRLLQMLEDRLCLQSRFGRQQFSNLFPFIRERIRPRSPVMLLSHLARQAPIPQVLSLSSGPSPPSPLQSPPTTSALLVARVALPAVRSPYKSSPTCTAFALPASG